MEEHRSKRSIVSAMLLVACWMTACQSNLVPKGVPLYSIELANSTTVDLTGVDVVFDQNGSGFPDHSISEVGNLPAAAVKGDSFIPVPIPQRARVGWTDPLGKRHQYDLNVREHCGPKFTGDIIFTIQTDSTIKLSFDPKKNSN